MNGIAQNRSNERPYFWLGAAADYDQVVIDALEKPEPPTPAVVIDSTDIDE